MKIKNILTIGVTLILMSSCSFLDFDETDNLKTKENTYKYFWSVEALLSSIYSYLPQDLGAIDGAMRDCSTDDAQYGLQENTVSSFYDGSWSSNKPVDDMFYLYGAIREANSFIDNIHLFDLDRYIEDTNYEQWKNRLQYFPYEARILRAHYFFELAKRYGDIAMPLKEMTITEANSLEKTSFHNVIKFIVNECDECAENLPVSYKGISDQTGRITKGYAMALKSRALLYDASPLHNQENDRELWKKAAVAAKDIIDSGHWHLDPEEDCNRIDSPEVILFRMNGTSSYFEQMNFPIRFTKGTRSNPACCNYPSQNLVDAFETINGYKVTLDDTGFISDDPLFNPQKPYENRDPRFYMTILAHGSDFKGSKINVAEGGADYFDVLAGGTPTGYFLRKNIIEECDFTPGQEVSKNHFWVMYRYAETLLTYAEAMTEYSGDPDYKDGELNLSAREALNMVRANAGMPAISESGKDAFMGRLRNEWRVEFAFEDHRFWNIRRWKLGAQQQDVYGVEIQSLGGNEYFLKKTCRKKYWDEKMNLYPIPQKELINNSNLGPQNIGW